MTFTDYSNRVQIAALDLAAQSPFGEPSEELVRMVTRSAGLPVTHEDDGFLVDPIRGAVFFKAYKPYGRDNAERALRQGWIWATKEKIIESAA